MGAGTIPLETSTTTFARQDADATAEWHAESGNITPSDLTIGAIVLTARTLAVLSYASVELIEDAVNAGQIIQNSIASAISAEMDRCSLYGNGTGVEPGGIIASNQTQTYAMGDNGASVTSWDPFSEAMVKIQNYNGNATGALYAPRTWKILTQLKQGGTNATLEPPAPVAALQRSVSSRVSIARTRGNNSTTSDIFVADWSQLIFGIRTQLNLEVSRLAGNSFSQMNVGFRGYCRMDVLIKQRPKHLSLIECILCACI